MVSYRSKLRIIADILSVASDGAKKTQIMYQANLNYKLLSRYLTEVMDAGLVRFVGGADCYRLTRKGQEFLVKYNEYFSRYKRLEKKLNDIRNEKMVLQRMIKPDLGSRSDVRAVSKKAV